ncbi:hypothetical protein GCM10009682_01760 [Luedemannella flava]|uniref:Uncharacterized protein n=1 Tax=Luedemannella flava TaxID=349316 RepID=A0ABN2LCH8_9ACTN
MAVTLAAYSGLMYPFAPAYGLSTRAVLGAPTEALAVGVADVVADAVVLGAVVAGADVVGGFDVAAAVVAGALVAAAVVAGVLPPHVMPLTENAVGTALALPQLPVKPRSVMDPPEATDPLYETLETVTFAPLCDHVPPQPWVTVWPLAKANFRVHEVHGSPVFFKVTAPWNPPDH